MIENLGNIKFLFSTLKDGINLIFTKTQKGKKKRIQRKIINLQLLLEDIIENASEIFIEISKIKRSRKLNYKSFEKFQTLIYQQHSTLSNLQYSLNDETACEILKVFSPKARREIVDLIHFKKGRILRLMWSVRDTSIGKIKKLYTDEYFQNGILLIEEIKECSNELSSLIREKMDIEDII